MQLDQRVLRTSEPTVSGYVHRDFHARTLRRNLLTQICRILGFRDLAIAGRPGSERGLDLHLPVLAGKCALPCTARLNNRAVRLTTVFQGRLRSGTLCSSERHAGRYMDAQAARLRHAQRRNIPLHRTHSRPNRKNPSNSEA
jgi:hypothetical protein